MKTAKLSIFSLIFVGLTGNLFGMANNLENQDFFKNLESRQKNIMDMQLKNEEIKATQENHFLKLQQKKINELLDSENQGFWSRFGATTGSLLVTGLCNGVMQSVSNITSYVLTNGFISMWEWMQGKKQAFTNQSSNIQTNSVVQEINKKLDEAEKFSHYAHEHQKTQSDTKKIAEFLTAYVHTFAQALNNYTDYAKKQPQVTEELEKLSMRFEKHLNFIASNASLGNMLTKIMEPEEKDTQQQRQATIEAKEQETMQQGL